jgi:hypothetical protein
VRAFDYRPFVVVDNHPRDNEENTTIIAHHGPIIIRHQMIDTINEIKQWYLKTKSEEFTLLYISHVEGQNCAGDDCTQPIVHLLNSLGIQFIMDCSLTSTLSYDDASRMGQLDNSTGSLLAIFGCIEENYDPSVTCYGVVDIQVGKMSTIQVHSTPLLYPALHSSLSHSTYYSTLPHSTPSLDSLPYSPSLHSLTPLTTLLSLTPLPHSTHYPTLPHSTPSLHSLPYSPSIHSLTPLTTLLSLTPLPHSTHISLSYSPSLHSLTPLTTLLSLTPLPHSPQDRKSVG